MSKNVCCALWALALSTIAQAQETDDRDSGFSSFGLYYGSLAHNFNAGEWYLHEDPNLREFGLEFIRKDADNVGLRAGVSIVSYTDWLDVGEHFSDLDWRRWQFQADAFGYLSEESVARPYYAVGGVLGLIPDFNDSPLMDIGLRAGLGIEFGPRPGTGAFLEFGYQHQVFVTYEGLDGYEFAFLGDGEGYGDSIGDWEVGVSLRFGARFGF